MLWLKAQNFASGDTETNPITRCVLNTINKISSPNFTVTLSPPRGMGWGGGTRNGNTVLTIAGRVREVLSLRTYTENLRKRLFPTQSYCRYSLQLRSTPFSEPQIFNQLPSTRAQQCV